MNPEGGDIRGGYGKRGDSRCGASPRRLRRATAGRGTAWETGL